MRLKNKVAIITGGTSGIGRATAILFAKEGAMVCITGRNQARLKLVSQKIKEFGGNVLSIRADIRFANDCGRTVDKTLKAFGKLDILFNNAGVFFPNTILKCSEAEWDMTLDTNLKSAYLMSKYALPSMLEQKSGVIIHNSSGWGIVGGVSAASYCASKGGMVLLTKAMAIDHSAQGIRVNCVCPGDVDTPMLRQDASLRKMPWEEYLAGAVSRPMGRIGTPEEIARAVLFLACDDSSFMTGAVLIVDGGGTAD